MLASYNTSVLFNSNIIIFEVYINLSDTIGKRKAKNKEGLDFEYPNFMRPQAHILSLYPSYQTLLVAREWVGGDEDLAL